MVLTDGGQQRGSEDLSPSSPLSLLCYHVTWVEVNRVMKGHIFTVRLGWGAGVKQEGSHKAIQSFENVLVLCSLLPIAKKLN